MQLRRFPQLPYYHMSPRLFYPNCSRWDGRRGIWSRYKRRNRYWRALPSQLRLGKMLVSGKSECREEEWPVWRSTRRYSRGIRKRKRPPGDVSSETFRIMCFFILTTHLERSNDLLQRKSRDVKTQSTMYRAWVKSATVTNRSWKI